MKELNPINYNNYKVYNVTKIKDKYGFRVVLTLEDGSEQTIQHSGFDKKNVAENEKYKVIADLVNGNYVAYKYITVKEYLEYWYEKQLNGRIKTYNTKLSYRNVIFNHIIPKIGALNLLNLTDGIIEKLYIDENQKSHSVCKLIRTVLISSLNDAKTDKFIKQNVALGVNIPKTVEQKIKEATTEKSESAYHTLVIDEKKTFTIEQIALLIKESKNTPIYMQVLFAALMGLRRSEINAIKYSDVDYFNKKLHLKVQLGKKLIEDEKIIPFGMRTKEEINLKTKSSVRILDIPDLVFEEILEKRKLYEKQRKRRINDKSNPFRDLNYICCSTYGRPRSKGFHTQYYNELKKKCKLPDLPWHKLRTTYTTILSKNNFSMKAISILLGHSSEMITFENYTDKNEIICDCLNELEPFINEVIKSEDEIIVNDCADDNILKCIQNTIYELIY